MLDVACGTGIVARLLSRAADPPAALTGLDPNAAMLAVAGSVAPAAAGIEWRRAPAEDMPFATGSFDVVFCQMGLQLMDDPAAALAEMRRVLEDGGRLYLGLPGPIPEILGLLASALERLVGPPAAAFVRRVFSLHDVDELERLLGDAGFARVSVEATDHELTLGPPREFLWRYIHSTPLAGAVAQVGAGASEALEREVLDQWTPFVRGPVLSDRVRFVVASGTGGGCVSGASARISSPAPGRHADRPGPGSVS